MTDTKGQGGMRECVDPEVGAMLFAFELGNLPEDDLERFEAHVLECDYCLSQLQSFEREGKLLATDQPLRKEVVRAVLGRQGRDSWLATLWAYLWPSVPFVFRPAVAYVVVVLLCISLLIPGTPGIWRARTGVDPIQPTHLLVLESDRAADETTVQITSDAPVALSFYFAGATAEDYYTVVLETGDGAAVATWESFRSFNDKGFGTVTLHPGSLPPGTYRLAVIDPRGSPPSNTRQYAFRMVE